MIAKSSAYAHLSPLFHLAHRFDSYVPYERTSPYGVPLQTGFVRVDVHSEVALSCWRAVDQRVPPSDYLPQERHMVHTQVEVHMVQTKCTQVEGNASLYEVFKLHPNMGLLRNLPLPHILDIAVLGFADPANYTTQILR